MTTILFGLAVLVLIGVAWYTRRQQKQEWIDNERYDESGDWLDKRSGERGTYGSLDSEMETSRKSTFKKGAELELARLIQSFAFEELDGFHTQEDDEILRFNKHSKKEATRVILLIEAVLKGKPFHSEEQEEGPSHPKADLLKKKMLEFTYAEFPAVLEQPIERIQAMDIEMGKVSEGLLRTVKSV